MRTTAGGKLVKGGGVIIDQPVTGVQVDLDVSGFRTLILVGRATGVVAATDLSNVIRPFTDDGILRTVNIAAIRQSSLLPAAGESHCFGQWDVSGLRKVRVIAFNSGSAGDALIHYMGETI
jgi:hypothetical protein